MGVASMVIGIVALLIGFIPFCGTWIIIPALAGLGLGIADLIIKLSDKKPKGMAVAGLVLNTLAIIVVALWWLFVIKAAKDTVSKIDSSFQQQMMNIMQDVQTMPGMQSPSSAQPPAPPQQMEPMQPMDIAEPAGSDHQERPQPEKTSSQ